MQTSLARRRRHRRNGGRRGSGGAASKVAIALPLFLFGTFVLLGVVGATAAVGRLRLLQPGPRGSQEAPREPRLRRGDDRLRPDRQDRAGPLRPGQARRRRRTTRSRPGSSTPRPSSRTRRSGRTPGSTRSASSRPRSTRPSGNERGASTITQQLVRARLLPPSAFEGGPLRAQDPRDHPVDPADPGVPGDRRQEEDHGGLPQPELLRQPELRDQGRRQELLRDRRPLEADPRPGGDPGRRSPSRRRPST